MSRETSILQALDATLRDCFMGPDRVGIAEQRNVVDALDGIARALHKIAEALAQGEDTKP